MTASLARAWTQLLVLSAALAVLPGCVDLGAIREFGAISASTADYPKLVQDYVEAPARLKRLAPPERGAGFEKDSKARAEQKDRLLLRQTAVVGYMDALADLAADDLVVYDDDIDALGKALQDNKFAGESDADAFAAIAKVLTKAVTDEWRRGQLQALITDDNAPVQRLIGTLRKVVSQGILDGDIAIERASLSAYYGTLKRDSRDPAGKAALSEWEDHWLSDVSAREGVATEYLKVLDKISAGHQKLFDDRAKLDSKETLRQIKVYAKDLQSLYQALH